MSTFVTALDPSEVSEAAVSPQPPADWWYANVVLDAPGTPVHGAVLIGIFNRFVGAFEETIQTLVFPAENAPAIQFGTGRVPQGTITASDDELNVEHGPSYLRGAYPDYQLHLEGQSADGQPVIATFVYESDVEPDRVCWIGSQLKHFVTYRLTASGQITIGDQTYTTTGVGYIEHAYGTFGWEGLGNTDTRFVTGWDWYWSPGGLDGTAVQFAGISLLGATNPSTLVSITADGKKFNHFTTAQIEPLEERQHEGVTYTHKLRVTDRNEHGELDMIVTRGGGAHQQLNQVPDGPKMFFRTGHAEFEGKASWDGAEYDLAAWAFGTATRIVLEAAQ